MDYKDKEELKDQFSKRLRVYLAKANRTQADLSKKLKVSTATTSDWCNGNAMPRMDKIIKIADWLEIEVADLLIKNPDYKRDRARSIEQFMKDNPEYTSTIEMVMELRPEDLATINALLKHFIVKGKE